MNQIDIKFYQLVDEIKQKSPWELYYHMRSHFEEVPKAIKESCITFFKEFPFWGKLDPSENCYEEIEQKAKDLSTNIDEIVWLYEKLEDYRSKYTLYAIIKNWYSYDFEETKKALETTYDDYFDLDLIPTLQNQVVVDLGAYVGDSVISYIKNYGANSYKKIYCYEITPETFEILKKNVEEFSNIDCRMKGVGEKVGSLLLRDNQTSSSANTLLESEGNVEMTTLDQDVLEPITLIKADIEGFEQKAIAGARNHILNDHPKLLISVYHHNEDLWKIPRMIEEISSDYHFYLRFHGSIYYPTEVTLIAI